jgi:hypothetical protein
MDGPSFAAERSHPLQEFSAMISKRVSVAVIGLAVAGFTGSALAAPPSSVTTPNSATTTTNNGTKHHARKHKGHKKGAATAQHTNAHKAKHKAHKAATSTAKTA